MMGSGGGIRAAAYALGDVTLTYSTLISLGAWNRPQTLSLPGVVVGDVLSVRPTGPVPDGYDIGAAFCPSNGQVTIIVSHPALAINGSYSIPVRVFKIVT